MSPDFTPHALQRAKLRKGISGKKAETWIRKGLERGKIYTDFTSWERRYLQKEGKNGCIALAYDGFCFILDTRGTLLTVYALPDRFGKKSLYLGKEKLRDGKKYLTRYEKEEENYDELWA